MSSDEALLILNAALFWVVAVGAVTTSLLVVLNRNPVASALSLVATMVLVAMLMIQTGAFFLGTVQILVYAGAVMVLFLFIIMLLDLKAESGKVWNLWGLLAGAFVAAAVGGVLFFLAGYFSDTVDVTALEAGKQDDVRLLGLELFGRFAPHVLVVGFLLLVAMAGVIILGQQTKQTRQLPTSGQEVAK